MKEDVRCAELAHGLSLVPLNSKLTCWISILHHLNGPGAMILIDRLANACLHHPMSEVASLSGVAPPGAIGIPDSANMPEFEPLPRALTIELVPEIGDLSDPLKIGPLDPEEQSNVVDECSSKHQIRWIGTRPENASRSTEMF